MNEEIKREVYQVGDLFRQLYDNLNKMENKKHLYKNLKELTIIEINTILAIGNEEMKSMSQIANYLGVSSGTPTVTIDRLVAKGYTDRIRDLEDRRQVFIKLSEKGKDVYNSVHELQQKVTERVFGILTENERKMLIDMLARINNRFDEVFSDLAHT
jgi:Transcriptional regulators